MKVKSMNETMTDCCSTPGLMLMEQALIKMQNEVQVKHKIERVFIADALDRVVAEDIYSKIDVPANDNSAMDGYAFRSQDEEFSSALKIVGRSFAGHPFDGEVKQGECIRIMTGAHIPRGADTVMMQENTASNGALLQVLKWPVGGNSIRPKGDDIEQGDKVMVKGTRLSPIDLGLIVSLGIAEVAVYKKIKVAVMASGDELIRAGDALKVGSLYESNSVVILAVLKRLNVEVRDMGIVEDKLDKIEAAFKQAMNWADVLITSGGVSVGDADYIKDVLQKLGTIGFWKLAIKPGKPFAFGQLDNCQFFGLPGNPVSAIVTLQQLVVPTLKIMQGENLKAPHCFQLPLNHGLKRKKGRKEFQRARICQDDNETQVLQMFHSQSSGVFRSMSESDGCVIIEAETDRIAPMELVNFMPFGALLGRQ